MSSLSTIEHIRTNRHIRTMRSIRTHTGPGRAQWPRLKETERLVVKEKRLQAFRQGTRYESRWNRTPKAVPPTVLRR